MPTLTASTTTRLLPPAEWTRLAGTEADTVWPFFDPATTQVLVVEREGQILATWSVLPVWHLECCWIHPDHRGKGSIARRLWTAMRAHLTSRGIRGVVTSAVDENVRRLITAHLSGVRLPGEMYAIPIPEGRSLCQP